MHDDYEHHTRVHRRGLEEFPQRLDTARRAAQSDHGCQSVAARRHDVVELHAEGGFGEVRRERGQSGGLGVA